MTPEQRKEIEERLAGRFLCRYCNHPTNACAEQAQLSCESRSQYPISVHYPIPALLSALDAAEARAVAAEDRVRELEPYAKFGRMFVEKVGMDDSWWGDEWSEDVMPLAVQAGIAERVPYAPEIHGEGVEAEPGDEIWVWLPLTPTRRAGGF